MVTYFATLGKQGDLPWEQNEIVESLVWPVSVESGQMDAPADLQHDCSGLVKRHKYDVTCWLVMDEITPIDKKLA